MLDGKQVREMRAKLQEKLDGLAEELGFKATVQSGKYLDTVVFKVECAPLQDDGSAVSGPEADFRRYAHLFGLEADHLGKQFALQGRTFTVSGLRPRATSYPIVATRDDGKKFKLSADEVRVALGLTR